MVLRLLVSTDVFGANSQGFFEVRSPTTCFFTGFLVPGRASGYVFSMLIFF